MGAETPKSLRTNFENLEVYKLAERLADEIWSVVGCWDHFSKDTIGRQVVRAADSIGANIAEGVGRGSYLDKRRFVRTARGSLKETKHWLRRAHSRHLLSLESVNTINRWSMPWRPNSMHTCDQLARSRVRVVLIAV